MSMDFNVYIRNLEAFNWTDCERYFRYFGMEAEVHPDADLKTQFGFLPIRFKLFDPDSPYHLKELVSGFEVFLEPFQYKQALSEFLGKGLKALLAKDRYLYSPAVDKKLKRCKYLIMLNTNDTDAFECRMTFAFAAYLCEACDGVFCNCQTDELVTSDYRSGITRLLVNAEAELDAEELPVHLFEGWR